MHNPERYNDIASEDEPGVVELILAKHRNGQIGTIKLRWIGEYTTFVGMEEKVKYAKPKTVEEIPPEDNLQELDEDLDGLM